MIEYKNFTCGYNKENILKIDTLKISSNLCVLGANGSGKSTLAKATCGLLEYKGNITFNNNEIKNIKKSDLAKLISYIPPKLISYDEYILVKEFVLLGRFAYKEFFSDYSQKDKNRVDEVLNELGISHLKESSLNALSSGESQLVLFAQCLVQESKVIIFDEPTANLDPKNSKIIATTIKKLQNKFTCVVITHDLALASYLDTSIAFIKNKNAYFYENKEEFFQENELKKLYEVDFKGLSVAYK